MAVASAVLLSLPYLLPSCGFLSLFAFIPLLSLERILSIEEKKGFVAYSALTFILWNVFTTFWVCNATVGGGIFASLANAAQMVLVFQLFHWSKKRLRGVLPYLFLAAMWLAWEARYFQVQISWPWLTLGHAFADSISLIQWYEYTGVMGGSLWVWASNLSLFGLMVAFSDGRWFTAFNPKARIASVVAPALVLLLPMLLSVVMWNQYEDESEKSLDVVLTQPNFNPYEKFVSLSRKDQDEFLLEQIDEALAGDSLQTPTLVLAPETFLSQLWLHDIEGNESIRRYSSWLSRHPSVTLLFGASTYDLIQSRKAPSVTARRLNASSWYESHNSALSLAGDGRSHVYHKSKLVVGTELTPYPSLLAPLDDKYLGGVIARCVGQNEPGLLYDYASSTPVAPIICYESVYGDWCRGYVQKGAQLLCVITNDAWWGDTPGYRQHLNLSRLRAIETRRYVARSANTGISAFINARGEILQRTGWWTPAILRAQVPLCTGQTFYVQHGDIIGRVSIFLFLLLAALWMVRLILRKNL